MVRWLSLAALLLALVVVRSDAQTLTGSVDWRPYGTLHQRADGSYGYIVSEYDDFGQWQVAFGDPRVWLDLVAANRDVLDDPDDIRAGQELNAPWSFVLAYRNWEAEHSGRIAPPGVKAPGTVSAAAIGASSPLPPAPQTAERSRILWAILLAVIATLAVIGIILMYLRYRNRMRSPYSGPPVREGGLPTADAAVAHFTDRYRTERSGFTVAASAALPSRVGIALIRAVDVRGPMLVRYAGSETPVRRDLQQWTPAWECRLTDGTLMYTLTACANDVRAGNGMSTLPETQVRARQDVPVATPQRQIWPTVEETPAQPTPATVPVPVLVIPSEVANYTSVKITSPSRYVLHTPDGRDLVVDVGVLGDVLTLGIDRDRIYAVVGMNRRAFGRLIQADRPAENAAEPTTESADGRAPQPVIS